MCLGESVRNKAVSQAHGHASEDTWLLMEPGDLDCPAVDRQAHKKSAECPHPP